MQWVEQVVAIFITVRYKIYSLIFVDCRQGFDVPVFYKALQGAESTAKKVI